MELNVWQVFLVAVALGADAFSVALGIGSGKAFRGQSFRLGFHFGLFQFLMPLIGFFIGSNVGGFVEQWDHWIASGILVVIGMHMIKEAIWSEAEDDSIDRSRGWNLVSLSVATSIDALAVGIALGMTGISPWWPSLLIGLVAGVMTLAGLNLGRRLRKIFGQIVEVIGGILLFFIAAKMFVM
ncbi:MAG: manganese efflux pump MntP family protein [bacterium]|jgi:putative Mn2+ efflux pump MntP|nr:manganese efflux pump MntP family protein [bacterium]